MIPAGLLVFVFVIGGVFGYVAFVIGKWRHSCIFWEVKAPYNVPMGWRGPLWKIVSWVLVTICSLVFATCMAVVIGAAVHPWIGRFSWGALLYGRWMLSGSVAHLRASRELAEIEAQFDPEHSSTEPPVA